MGEQADLFTATPRRTRNPNRQPAEKDVVIRYELTKSERACLKHREPGPSGKLGGYQQFENWLVDELDHHPATTGIKYVVELDTKRRSRLTNYIQLHGSGGPNADLRKAFRRFFGNGT
jgi:hypothetical protein